MANDVVVPTAPALSRIANVELMHTGTWPISTGVATFTTGDLTDAVAALDCPAVRRPILKLGHTDPRFDGEPAVGYIDNLAVADNGRTLVGDYAGMPGWLGPVIASAYPDRSIEGVYDFRCQLGHTHPFVLTGLALLGVMAPGIGTLESLQDVAALYGVDVAATPGPWPPEPEPDPRYVGPAETPVVITATTEGGAMPNPAPTKVAATVTTEDVRRAYYAANDSWDLWIEEIQLDPAMQLIVCDDSTGDRSRVPVVIGDGEGDEAVSFGDPVKVLIRYDDAAKVAASPGLRSPIKYATKAESRPAAASPEPPAEPVDALPNPTPEVIVADASSTLREGILSRLGVTDTSLDDDALLAALGEALDERAEPTTPEPEPLPEGKVIVSQDVLDELKVAAAAGAEARSIQLREERDKTLAAAVRAGKFGPARKELWAKKWDKDPEGTKADLAELPDGLVPVAASGLPGGDTASDDDAVLASLGFKTEVKV